MIVLAKQASDLTLPTIAALDIEVERNAYGRQVDSFEAELVVPALGEAPLHAVFIRAPVVREVIPPAEALARLEDGTPVIVREGKLLATSFHPELTDDTRLHQYFVEMAREGAKAPAEKR
jgi:5'-phosphate synthase pdxT subunit